MSSYGHSDLRQGGKHSADNPVGVRHPFRADLNHRNLINEYSTNT